VLVTYDTASVTVGESIGIIHDLPTQATSCAASLKKPWGGLIEYARFRCLTPLYVKQQ
jgi:hypothetical protein